MFITRGGLPVRRNKNFKYILSPQIIDPLYILVEDLYE